MRTFDCWIFDLDGTLTEACHDFAAIKNKLGLPPDLALLEGVALAPVADRPLLLEAICRWERGLAEAARPSAGAEELLSVIQERGHGSASSRATRGRRRSSRCERRGSIASSIRGR